LSFSLSDNAILNLVLESKALALGTVPKLKLWTPKFLPKLKLWTPKFLPTLQLWTPKSFGDLKI
jgi:hypothetical protein